MTATREIKVIEGKDSAVNRTPLQVDLLRFPG